jgi:mannose-6-phosphate isomerase
VTPTLKPCLLERESKAKVWGGNAIERLFGTKLPPDRTPGVKAGTPIGETWELFDRPEGSSRIRGSHAKLRDLMEENGTELLGRGVRAGHGGRFPLLIKYIDAHERLSVQVHPDDQSAKPRNDGGKSEAWVVLATGERASIVCGLKPGVSREQFQAVAHTKAVEELLWSFRPRVGECVHIPAGTVHAIGPDVVVFEVQQNSDLTYRLYDWGRDRPVHVQDALAVARVESNGRPVVQPKQLGRGQELVIAEPHFRVCRLTIGEKTTLPVEGRCKVVNVITGGGVLGWYSGGEDEPLVLRPGDTALVPACIESVFLSPIGSLSLLWTEPGSPA